MIPVLLWKYSLYVVQPKSFPFISDNIEPELELKINNFWLPNNDFSNTKDLLLATELTHGEHAVQHVPDLGLDGGLE